MTAVYLATSNDLTWYLSTTSLRTMLPVLLCIGAAAAVLVHDIETSGSAPAEPLPQKSPSKKIR
jgi:hypothetical protein